jgi:TfoX/Sxy family transcriptional regulator of competence genes
MIMKTPPESFLIFKEELKKARLEKERLQKEYKAKLSEMNIELDRLKEQIAAQQELMKTTLEYAIRLEDNLDTFKVEVANTPTMKKKSFH